MIGHLRHPDIGISGRKGVGRCVRTSAGQRVVERGFARVGETDEAETFHSPDEATDADATTVYGVSNVHASSPASERPDTVDADEHNRSVSSTDAENAFSKSVLVSAVRCTFTYLLIPFGFPLIGLSGSVGPWIGLPVGLIAIVANIVSIQRFHRSDHRWMWPMTVINIGIIALLVVLVVLDAIDIVG